MAGNYDGLVEQYIAAEEQLEAVREKVYSAREAFFSISIWRRQERRAASKQRVAAEDEFFDALRQRNAAQDRLGDSIRAGSRRLTH